MLIGSISFWFLTTMLRRQQISRHPKPTTILGTFAVWPFLIDKVLEASSLTRFKFGVLRFWVVVESNVAVVGDDFGIIVEFKTEVVVGGGDDFEVLYTWDGTLAKSVLAFGWLLTSPMLSSVLLGDLLALSLYFYCCMTWSVFWLLVGEPMALWLL